LFIGDGSLQSNVSYTVSISNLRQRQLTEAFINGVQAPVNYLVTVDTTFSFANFNGDVFIGGYRDVEDLKVSVVTACVSIVKVSKHFSIAMQVNTERLTAYLVVCLEYIELPGGRIALDTSNENVGVSS
jgi:hypothetical protein